MFAVCHVPLTLLILMTNLWVTTPILQKDKARKWNNLPKVTEEMEEPGKDPHAFWL